MCTTRVAVTSNSSEGIVQFLFKKRTRFQIFGRVWNPYIFSNVLVQYVCMYVCMVITDSRVWINRVRLPILLVVS